MNNFIVRKKHIRERRKINRSSLFSSENVLTSVWREIADDLKNVPVVSSDEYWRDSKIYIDFISSFLFQFHLKVMGR